MGIPVVSAIPFNAVQQTGDPPALSLQVPDPEPGMKLEDAADDLGNHGLHHLDGVARHVTIKQVLSKQLVHMRVPCAGPLVKTPRDIQLFVECVERVPVIGVPEVAVYQVGSHERAGGAQFVYTPHQLPAGQVDIVRGQHGGELQLVRAVPTKLMDPVVVGLAQGEREQRVHPITRQHAETDGGEEDGDIGPFHRQRHYLSFGVVVPLDGEIHVSARRYSRSRLKGGVDVTGWAADVGQGHGGFAVFQELGLGGDRQARR